MRLFAIIHVPQDILRQSAVQVHIEVRPKYLIPDTNCFIDSCQSLIRIAEAYPLFQLLVPLVGEFPQKSQMLTLLSHSTAPFASCAVVNELDGLSKGNSGLSGAAVQKKSDPVHVQKVAEASKDALAFLKAKKHPGVK